ncbi:MAG TPA: hypothetical protein VNG12_20490, partial [Acidimicrobiales bacterium]|nr:hypothetical protein [Acidimicrobiales bacterium]
MSAVILGVHGGHQVIMSTGPATDTAPAMTRTERRRWNAQIGSSGVWLPISTIVVAVVVAHAPVLSGWLDPNPIHIVGNVNTQFTPGPLPGYPFIDPNIGFGGQALSHRAMLDWFSGQVPWWNPYEGVGAPLTAGFQAGSFFPPSLFTLLPDGQVFFRLVLEITAGIATFLLLRQLAVRRWIATLGGVLFALNGTFAWMGHAPSNPVAFLPLLLLGIERAFRAAEDGRRGGWLLVPVAIALSIVAGFPETAFIDALLAALWIALRLFQGSPRRRRVFAAKVVTGGGIGLLLATPLLVAVYAYSPYANIGLHSQAVDDAITRAGSALLVVPYSFGPIAAFVPYDPTGTIANAWGGGYVTTSLLFLSLVGLAGARHRGVRIAMAGWATFALMRTFGVGIAFEVTRAIPYLDRTVFSSWSAPSWELAILLLAMLGLDDLMDLRVNKVWVAGAALVSLALTGLAVHIARSLLGDVRTAPGHELAANLSAAWAFLVIILVFVGAFSALFSWRLAGPLLCVVMFLDVAGMFVVPELSNPRDGQVDTRLIAFLQDHLGTSRFYTFGPISPNYGSYFGIASINVNDLPVPKIWDRYITTNLDTNAFPLEFTGYVRAQPNGPTAVQEFQEHIANYAWVGVKYVVTSGTTDADSLAAPGRLRLAFADPSYDVFELEGTAPFFQALRGQCTVRWSSWNAATSRCSHATRIVRRELYMPG